MNKHRAQEIHYMLWDKLIHKPFILKQEAIMELWTENRIDAAETIALGTHMNCAACVIAGRGSSPKRNARFTCPIDWFPGQRMICVGHNPICTRPGSPYLLWCSVPPSRIARRTTDLVRQMTRAARMIRDAEWR